MSSRTEGFKNGIQLPCSALSTKGLVGRKRRNVCLLCRKVRRLTRDSESRSDGQEWQDRCRLEHGTS